MKFEDIKKKLLESDHSFREVYLKRNLPLEISHKVIKERIKKGMTQEDLAKVIGTKQSGVARIERGNSLPSINTLEKVASAIDKKLVIDFVDTETRTNDFIHQNLQRIVLSAQKPDQKEEVSRAQNSKTFVN